MLLKYGTFSVLDSRMLELFRPASREHTASVPYPVQLSYLLQKNLSHGRNRYRSCCTSLHFDVCKILRRRYSSLSEERKTGYFILQEIPDIPHKHVSPVYPDVATPCRFCRDETLLPLRRYQLISCFVLHHPAK